MEDYPLMEKEFKKSRYTLIFIIPIVILILLILVSFIAYYFGLDHAKKELVNNLNNLTLIPSIKPSTNQKNPNNKIKWVELTRDLGKVTNNSTWYPGSYTIRYPSNSNVFIYDGDSVAWPVSQIELFLNKAVTINSPLNSDINYQITIGESNIDPLTCYKTTCPEIFDSIDSIEPIKIANITGKIIHGKAYNGGGVKLLTPSLTETVILPYNNKFIILHNLVNSSTNSSEIFKYILDEFKLTQE